MVLKMLVLMFCNTDTLMQPESKKEKETKMNNYSWIYKFNDTSSREPFFYYEWGSVYSFFN